MYEEIQSMLNFVSATIYFRIVLFSLLTTFIAAVRKMSYKFLYIK